MIQSRCLSTQSWCALQLNQQDTVLVITTYCTTNNIILTIFGNYLFLSLFQTVTGIYTIFKKYSAYSFVAIFYILPYFFIHIQTFCLTQDTVQCVHAYVLHASLKDEKLNQISKKM